MPKHRMDQLFFVIDNGNFIVSLFFVRTYDGATNCALTYGKGAVMEHSGVVNEVVTSQGSPRTVAFSGGDRSTVTTDAAERVCCELETNNMFGAEQNSRSTCRTAKPTSCAVEGALTTGAVDGKEQFEAGPQQLGQSSACSVTPEQSLL